MNKFLSLFLSVSVIMTSLILVTPVYAADTIQSGQSVEVMFSGKNKITKNFTYTVPDNGYMYYSITPKYEKIWTEATENEPYSEKYYTYFNLSQTSLTYNYKEYIRASWIEYGDNWRSENLSFKKGSQITISLTDTAGYNTETCYILTVFFTKVNNFEIENNDSKKTATKILTNKIYTGIIIDGDTDYWVFNVPKNGKYKISAVELDGGYHNTVYAYRGTKQLSHINISSGSGWNTVYKGKLKKGQKIYIKITNGSNGEMYKLKVKKL